MTWALVDTDVVSMIFKGDSRAELYEQLLHGHLLAISFMTRAELALWPLVSAWGPAKTIAFQSFLEDYVVVPFDDPLCDQWARVRFESRRKGRELTHSDAWVAATALLYDLPLVTNNARHFSVIERLRLLT